MQGARSQVPFAQASGAAQGAVSQVPFAQASGAVQGAVSQVPFAQASGAVQGARSQVPFAQASGAAQGAVSQVPFAQASGAVQGAVSQVPFAQASGAVQGARSQVPSAQASGAAQGAVSQVPSAQASGAVPGAVLQVPFAQASGAAQGAVSQVPSAQASGAVPGAVLQVPFAQASGAVQGAVSQVPFAQASGAVQGTMSQVPVTQESGTVQGDMSQVPFTQTSGTMQGTMSQVPSTQASGAAQGVVSQIHLAQASGAMQGVVPQVLSAQALGARQDGMPQIPSAQVLNAEQSATVQKSRITAAISRSEAAAPGHRQSSAWEMPDNVQTQNAAAEVHGLGAPNREVVMSVQTKCNCKEMPFESQDALYQWYTSHETDWEGCRYLVPAVACSLQECPSKDPSDEMPQYILESVSWPYTVDIDRTLEIGIDRHRVLAQVLEADDTGSDKDRLGDISGIAATATARLCRLEADNQTLQEAADQARLQQSGGSSECPDKLTWRADEQDETHPKYPGAVFDLNVGSGGAKESSETVPMSEEYLQTKTIPNEVVRTELSKWLPSIRAEYDSLVHETKAVRPLTDQQFTNLLQDPSVQHELVPGRAIFTVKAHSGRLKTRVVACGCFQTSAARTREDKYASGVSAESTRMLLRFAGLTNLQVGVLDIKTAFLHAPVVTPNSETVIVRVPSILRASGVCSEKYWVVDKALYGL